MESTWYVYPGQTESPRLRSNALVATPAAWKRLTGYLEADKKRLKAIEKEKAHRKYIKDESHAMTKNWDNSIEKIRQRFLEDHEKKVQEKEQNLVKRYLELRKEQEDERKKIIDAAKKKMYMFQEKPRSLNSSLLLSEVLYERNLQKEFDKQEQERERNEDAEYAATVRLNAEKEKQENAETRSNRKEKDKEYTTELKKQIKDNEENKRRIREERLRIEKLENERSVEEAKLQKQKEIQMREERKKQIRREVDEFNQMQKILQEEEQRLEQLQEKMNKIYSNAKCRIEDKKVQRVKEVQEEKIKTRDKIAAKVVAKQADFAEVENRMLENARKESEKREIQKLESEKIYRNKLHQDLLDYRKECIERKLKEDQQQKEIQKWELCNRLKTNEVLQVYDKEEEQKQIDYKIEYRKELFKQMEEIEKELQYVNECKKHELDYYKNKTKRDDSKFFAYANEVLELAKSRGRSIEPILKVIEQYKIENELKPKKKNRSMLTSKVPINN